MNQPEKIEQTASEAAWDGGPWLRPPWFRAEALRAGACDACGACVRACPRDLLLLGRDGAPEIDFARGGCDFCQACLQACERGVFAAPASGRPWRYKATVGAECLAFQGLVCQLCEQYCENGAISFDLFAGGFALARVGTADCSGCGACIAACPADAITIRDIKE